MPIVFLVRLWTNLSLSAECAFISDTAQSSRSSNECVVNHELNYVGLGKNKNGVLPGGEMVVNIGDCSTYIIGA